ncbi:hypothetical protein ACFL5P_04360 [candidate division KSB1 bacterium]
MNKEKSFIRAGWDKIPLPDQAKRILIIVIIAVFSLIFLRSILVPETFGELGHFRSSAIDYAASLPISYTGETACIDCHDDVGVDKSMSYHRLLSCEVCHGPGVKHAEDDPEEYPLTPSTDRNFCLRCHSYNASRPTGFPQIDPILHNVVDNCIDCHDPHQPDPPDTPEECGSCHGNIARTKAISPHATIQCIRCHSTPEEHKTTPRIFTVEKPINREFCGDCHSMNADSPGNIPRISLDEHEKEYLCWQCHYPHYPEK